MRRCIMCDEPDPMYLPADDVDDVGLYSCGRCGFEMEGPRMVAAPNRITAPTPPALPRPEPVRVDVDELRELVTLEGALL
jgi:hypothetical protein